MFRGVVVLCSLLLLAQGAATLAVVPWLFSCAGRRARLAEIVRPSPPRRP